MSAKRKAGEEHQGQSAKKARTESKASVIVSGPIDHTSRASIKKAFSRFGVVTGVSIRRKGMGYVNFRHRSAVDVALDAQRVKLPNGLLVNVTQCRTVQEHQGPVHRAREAPRVADVGHLGNSFGQIVEKAIDDDTIVKTLNKHSNMHDQITELTNLLVLSEEEVSARELYCSMLCSLLAIYFPKCSMTVFGSSANGCGVKGCDLDMYLDFGCDGPPDQPAEMAKNKGQDKQSQAQLPSVQSAAVSQAVRELLWQLPARDKLQFIRKVLWHHRAKSLGKCAFINARCPIVRFDDVRAGLHCDINATMRLSMVNTDLLKTYVRAHPAVRPLVVAVRSWFVAHQLLDTQKRLFSSYAVYMLVCCYLQCTSPPVLPTLEHLAELHVQAGGKPDTADGVRCEFLRDVSLLPVSRNVANLGDLFRGLFEFLLDIDFQKEVILLRNATLVPRQFFYEQLRGTPDFEAFDGSAMVLQDPIDPSRNVTRQIAAETLQLLLKNVRAALEAMRRGAGLGELLTVRVEERVRPDAAATGGLPRRVRGGRQKLRNRTKGRGEPIGSNRAKKPRRKGGARKFAGTQRGGSG